MFSNPPHDLAAAATIAATLHNPTKLCLTSRNLMMFINALCCLQPQILFGELLLGEGRE